MLASASSGTVVSLVSNEHAPSNPFENAAKWFIPQDGSFRIIITDHERVVLQQCIDARFSLHGSFSAVGQIQMLNLANRS